MVRDRDMNHPVAAIRNVCMCVSFGFTSKPACKVELPQIVGNCRKSNIVCELEIQN